MGTWGSGSFDNDAATDWVTDLEDADDLTIAVDALERVRTGEYVGADDAAVAIAAAEVVAAAGGRPGPDLPPNVAAWIERSGLTLDPEHAEAASAAIERIRGDDSELADRWEELRDGGWHSRLDELAERLGS